MTQLHDGVLNPSCPPQPQPQPHLDPAAMAYGGMALDVHAVRAKTQLDEGFSEGQSDSDVMYTPDPAAEYPMPDDDGMGRLLQRVLALPTEQRKQFADDLVRSLPNSHKEQVKRLIENLTHFDPAAYLAYELMLHVLSYLPPSDLLVASTVSRAWRYRAQDERLWYGCFKREGWELDKSRIEAFEKLAERRGVKIAEGTMRRPARLERKESRKRKTAEAFSEGDRSPLAGASITSALSVDRSAEALQLDSDCSSVDAMEGVEITAGSVNDPASDTDGNIPDALWTSTETAGENDDSRRSSTGTRHPSDSAPPPNPSNFKLSPTVFRDSSSPNPRVSWPYLYKQRRRLESNWEHGKYKMFQLPHPCHPDEGHEECVYAIQHNNQYLVSGSRDRTIRIWDLATNRLRGQPLRGHDASVLCLQFDDRPEHDIIVSGGSDSFVIVWKFSTGEIITKMTRAHDESVLNLRFDDRYIVTCSKDKKIKIWSRQALARDSPLIPSHVLANFNRSSDIHTADQLIKEYTLLTTLHGHQAAVNAVNIHHGTIVSASGDRTIRSWDIDTGELKKTYVGHIKGIACVQFDGRRIVSGSSDKTVRIFDADQQAEIACLTGHIDLVRTVQARFGDLNTVSDEELANEAKRADRAFLKAVSKGMKPASGARRGPRNAGSARPEDMLHLGTKIPPGGGGTRWAKIVSGSYDESVILWKRDGDGRWTPKLHLYQDANVTTADRRRQPLPAPMAHVVGGAQAANAQPTAVQGPPAQTNAHPQQHPPPPNQQTTTTGVSTTTTTTNSASGPPTAPPQHALPWPGHSAAGPLHGPLVGPHRHESNRVFKLQFDARRIICCSQNKVIVGWDFANGDVELERIGEWSVETP